jgi:hypothetical protein
LNIAGCKIKNILFGGSAQSPIGQSEYTLDKCRKVEAGAFPEKDSLNLTAKSRENQQNNV